VSHPVTGEEQTIVLDRNAFAEAVRLQLYSVGSNRRLPLMLMRAYAGDYRELAQAALRQNRGARGNIAWGMLMCVTGSEDISRIDSGEIAEACAGTFLEETRIRSQMAVAAIWPSGRVPKKFGKPVSIDIPVLLFSGTHDPSTAPEWGAEAARHLPNSLHVVVPSGHGVSGPQVERLEQAFLERGSVQRLDLSEVEGLTLPPLVLTETRKED
jgi:pimeloyl-ACP methyl ester carboxylesterase